jgi:hypothetical protein
MVALLLARVRLVLRVLLALLRWRRRARAAPQVCRVEPRVHRVQILQLGEAILKGSACARSETLANSCETRGGCSARGAEDDGVPIGRSAPARRGCAARYPDAVATAIAAAGLGKRSLRTLWLEHFAAGARARALACHLFATATSASGQVRVLQRSGGTMTRQPAPTHEANVHLTKTSSHDFWCSGHDARSPQKVRRSRTAAPTRVLSGAHRAMSRPAHYRLQRLVASDELCLLHRLRSILEDSEFLMEFLRFGAPARPQRHALAARRACVHVQSVASARAPCLRQPALRCVVRATRRSRAAVLLQGARGVPLDHTLTSTCSPAMAMPVAGASALLAST